jgi:hypothetical protein
MGRLRFGQSAWLVSTISLFTFLTACGGTKPPGPSPFPARVTLNPSPSYSMQVGTTLGLSAGALNSSGTGLRPTFTFAISPVSPAGVVPTGVLDIAPNGFACAGTWNAPAYTICTPGNTGTVAVTASALGATSAPTLFFVHGPIDNIQISVIPPVNSPPPACPAQQSLPPACNLPFNGKAANSCVSQNQVETLQATAYSQGTDITASVGPFTWSQATNGVATITPVVNTTFNVATNQASASVGATPGQTGLIASASGVYSQPYYFETCPVQCIAMQLSVNGQYSDLTSFVVSKGTSETLLATAVDVQGCIVPKPPLTWVSSLPAALAPGTTSTSCSGTTCTISSPQPGVAVITASCTPPACNVGFPLNPANLDAPYIPQPVYPVTAISGLVTGNPVATSVLVTSQDCYSDPLCAVALYNVPTTTNLPGNASEVPTQPNSLLYDPAGDTAFMGSETGALVINPGGLSGGSNPYGSLAAPGTPRGVVTGKVLAVSLNGRVVVFSDTVSTPNQVYVSTVSPQTTTALNINSATAAAVSPDGLKAFILGDGGNTLYIYSPLQTLQPGVALPAPASTIAFNSTGSFALFSGGSAPGTLAIYRTCDNSVVAPALSASQLPGPPTFLKMVPAGNIPLNTPFGDTSLPQLQTAGLDFFFGLDSTGIDIIATTSSQPALTALCPQPVTLAQTTANAPFPPVHINLNQGTFHPINFFLSPDTSRAYIVTSDLGVLVYDFSTGAVSAKIGLANEASPVAAGMTVDGTLIYVAGSDGLLHQLNTTLGVDFYQTSFLPLADSTNDFCYTGQNCQPDLLAVKP